MATFIAQVRDNRGKTSKQKVEATSLEMARAQLQNQYAAVGKIDKAMSFDLNLAALGERFTKVTVKDKAIFSRQFAVMVNAGVAIVRCLGILSDQCPNPKLKKAVTAISGEVQQGTTLSESMRKHPDCFDTLYISMVEAGEVGVYLTRYSTVWLNCWKIWLDCKTKLNRQ